MLSFYEQSKTKPLAIAPKRDRQTETDRDTERETVTEREGERETDADT